MTCCARTHINMARRHFPTNAATNSVAALHSDPGFAGDAAVGLPRDDWVLSPTACLPKMTSAG